MIIAHLFGGLGNQLFQYAMARQHAHATSAALRLDPFSYQIDTARAFELHRCQVTAPLARWRDIAALCPAEALTRLLPRPLHYRFWNCLRPLGIRPLCRVRIQEAADALTEIPLREKNLVRERKLTFDPAAQKMGDDCLVVGCWHNQNYFSQIRPLLQKEFRPVIALSGADAELRRRIASNLSVCVHARRGDKVGRADFKATSASYCLQAMALARQKLHQPCFYLFTDDPAWAQRELGNPPDLTIVSDGKRGAVDDFALMRACQHFIIAASSLSWWAAWLGASHSTIVISPPAAHWVQGRGYDTCQVLPREWVVLEAGGD